jgi:hypothetical protein
MNNEKIAYFNGSQSTNGSKVKASTAIETLAYSIETAHDNGALFSLAAHIKSLMEEHHIADGPHTIVELEVLIALAAKAMVNE